MKANETNISLECAKLLNDCGLDSKYYYEPTTNPHKEVWRIVFGKNNFPEEFPHAFAWQEILWKYHKEFFGEEENMKGLLFRPYEFYSHKIITRLQEGRYEEAEKIFIENCILIDKK